MIHYTNMIEAVFKERPNRFIAHCEIEGQEVVAHVKNTGKCRELLVPGVTVYLQHHDNPNRKTAYSLIGVQKGERLINMDSQVPNKVCIEALKNGKLKLPGIDEPFTLIKGEYTYGNSRFDVYVETESEKAFIEVKGVTLEADGVVRFPDAPTERGVKHLKELMEAYKDGYKAYALFIIQMKDVSYFAPNDKMHRAFGDALREAAAHGVHILAYDTEVEIDGIGIGRAVDVCLEEMM